jgi:hypothetical protein
MCVRSRSARWLPADRAVAYVCVCVRACIIPQHSVGIITLNVFNYSDRISLCVRVARRLAADRASAHG